MQKKYPQCEFMGVDIMVEENRNLIESNPNSRYVPAFIAEKGMFLFH